jgi:hypothetical protein
MMEEVVAELARLVDGNHGRGRAKHAEFRHQPVKKAPAKVSSTAAHVNGGAKQHVKVNGEAHHNDFTKEDFADFQL